MKQYPSTPKLSRPLLGYTPGPIDANDQVSTRVPAGSR